MGNEMGNNNVSGLQEEEKARTEEDQGKFLQDDNHADELKGEIRTKLEAEEKDFHVKRKLDENEDTKEEDNTYLIGEDIDVHEVLVPSETLLADLKVEETSEENETSDGNEEHDAEFKLLSVPVEIPPLSNDADFKSEDQEFASSDIDEFLEKTNLDGNLLTAEHGSEEEMLIGREYIEVENQTVDPKAGSGERDPNSDQQEVVQAEQVAEGIRMPQSENGHSGSNEVAENLYSCVKPETGDQIVATGMLPVKAKADEDECEMLFCEDKLNVFIPEEVDRCSEDEHNVDQSPLNVLQLQREAPESAVEASYKQLEAMISPLLESEAPKDALNSTLKTLKPPPEALESPLEASYKQVEAMISPLLESEAPKDALNSPLETLEPPPEASESPLEASHPQKLAPALLIKASDSPLEESEAPLDALNPPTETLEPPLEALESPSETSDPRPLGLDLIVKASDPFLEVSNSLLEASEPSIETSESPSEDSDPPVGASKSRLETQLEASELTVEASDSPLEASESQLEAFPRASSINPSQEVYEPHDKTINVKEAVLITSDGQNGETKLANNKAQCFEEKDQNFEIFESKTSQSEKMFAGSDCNKNDRENALASSVEKDCSVIESDLHNDEPQVAFLNQTLKPCIEEQPMMEESMLLREESKPIGTEVEIKENEGDYTKAQICEELKGLKTDDFIASRLEFLATETDSKKSAEQSAHGFNSTNGIGENCQLEDLEVKCNEDQITSADKSLKLDSYDVADTMSEIEEVSTESNVTEYKHDEDRPGEEFGDKEKESLLENEKDRGDIVDNSISLKSGNQEQSAHGFNSTNGIGENCQLEDLEVKCNEDQITSADESLKLDAYDVADTMSEIEAVSTESNVTEYKHDEDRPREEIGDKEKESLLENDKDRGDIIDYSMSPKSGNHAQDVPPYFPDSEALKDKNEMISDSKSEFFIITERFHASPSVAIVQSMMPTPEKEALQNIQETSVMDDQSSKGQETVEKLMTEPSSDNASNHVEFRKSPSFHFDLSIETKCDESDQTPLLCHEKIAGTNLISRDDAVFKKDKVQNDYNASQDEAVLVEEKTIRMERSDSERPSAPFLSFLQKEESAEILVTPEKQEKQVADKKTKKDPWTVIHKTFALTSPRDTNGKRKAKSSIFSTCICCATKNP